MSGGSIPISSNVSSSAQSSTTTAILATLSLNGAGNVRSAFSTNTSNCLRVISPSPRDQTTDNGETGRREWPRCEAPKEGAPETWPGHVAGRPD